VAAAGIVLGFLGPRGSTPMRWLRAAGGVAAVAVALGGLFVAEAESLIEWTPYSEDALARAAAEQRPVFIDFEAEWCLPCREMDHTTFRDPGVVRASRALAMLRADVTEQDEAAETLMRRFQVVGVPTYIVLGPDGQERWRQVGYVPAPELLRALSLGRSGGAAEAASG
jgi:thiol:disulfide interchange protein DsbD